MPKATKKSAREQSPPPSEDHDSTDAVEASASDQEQDRDVSFHPVVSPNNIPTMFMPYIEGPKMNWTVDDGLYHRFLKWHLKCEMILIANWQISLPNKNAKKSSRGLAILVWIFMCHGTYQRKTSH